MAGMFDGFSFNIFDDAIFDTKIQDIPALRSRSIILIPAVGQDGKARISISVE